MPERRRGTASNTDPAWRPGVRARRVRWSAGLGDRVRDPTPPQRARRDLAHHDEGGQGSVGMGADQPPDCQLGYAASSLTRSFPRRPAPQGQANAPTGEPGRRCSRVRRKLMATPRPGTPAAIPAVPHGVPDGSCPHHGTGVGCPVWLGVPANAGAWARPTAAASGLSEPTGSPGSPSFTPLRDASSLLRARTPPPAGPRQTRLPREPPARPRPDIGNRYGQYCPCGPQRRGACWEWVG